jgi:hypothetical protein
LTDRKFLRLKRIAAPHAGANYFSTDYLKSWLEAKGKGLHGQAPITKVEVVGRIVSGRLWVE